MIRRNVPYELNTVDWGILTRYAYLWQFYGVHWHRLQVDLLHYIMVQQLQLLLISFPLQFFELEHFLFESQVRP